ncbi:unnamed protein product [Mytilus coruscus]|uniref:Uncharacterized protein n=1 Tax=Mytilus coruscus TaxID=42192 RepID=A0A6J8C9Q7_MYTCO|nr:unnamed protein product [Mytilus coruscus]
MTGLWDKFDPDIQYACESTYMLKYKVFQNIFCYICNPTDGINNKSFRNCNVTGFWTPYDKGLHNACQFYRQTDTKYSFINVFCFLCNRDHTNNSSFQDAQAAVTFFVKGNIYFYQLTNIKKYSLLFFKQYLKEQMNNTIATTNGNKSFTLNLTQILLKAYAHTPLLPGLCNETLLQPNALNIIKSTKKGCSCNLSSFYNGELPLCLDLSLSNPFICVSNVINFGYYGKTGERIYAMVGSCSVNVYSTVLRERCAGNANDIYSFLPVVDTLTNIQYKNVHCFICNQVIDVDNIDNVVNSDNYKSMFDINIICKQTYIDFSRLLSLTEIIRNALINNCRISLLNPIVHPRSCHNDGVNVSVHNSIHQCNNSGLWPEFDLDIKLACEQLSYVDLRMVDDNNELFKNMFCSICNPPYFDEEMITNCSISDSCPIISENRATGCRVFPKVVNHLPYKNGFCYMCNEHPCRKKFRPEIDIEFMPDTGTCDFEPYKCVCLGPGCAVPKDIPGNICRNVTCFPGRYFKDEKCDPLFPIARNIRYNLGIFITNQTRLLNETEQILLRLLEDTVKNHSVGIVNLFILKYEQFSKSLCLEGPSDSKMITYVAVDLFIKSKINRNDLEQSLLNIAEKSSDKQSIEIHLASSLPELLKSVLVDNDFRNESRCWKSEENRDYLKKYGSYVSTNIQRQIICPQLEFDFNQFEIDGSSLLITKHSIKIPKDQVLMDSNNKIRVCVDDFSSFVTKKFSKSSKEYALEITTIVCGTNIGYGEKNCFISGHIPKLAAFICPVAVICAINIWLFGVTAYKIYNRPIIQSTANTKHDFFVYIKLFSLTGITWIGQIIDSFVPLSVFSFIVTILTGLQGLFIFLSFVCNKRVIKLFWEIFNVIRKNEGGKVPDPLSKTNSNPYPNSCTSITSDTHRPP